MKSQLRGKKLEEVLVNCILELADGEENYIFNASEVSRRSGISRPSINSRRKLVDETLAKIRAARRMSDGHATLEHAMQVISKLRSQLKEEQEEKEAYKSHVVEIYRNISSRSIDARLLLSGVDVCSSTCPLCLSRLGTTKPKSNSNVVSLNKD